MAVEFGGWEGQPNVHLPGRSGAHATSSRRVGIFPNEKRCEKESPPGSAEEMGWVPFLGSDGGEQFLVDLGDGFR